MPASATCASGPRPSGGIFDYAAKERRLAEIQEALQDPAAWDDPRRAEALNRERSQLEGVVDDIAAVDRGLADAAALLELAEEE